MTDNNTRGFIKTPSNTIEDFIMPKRSTKNSAGYDFFNNSKEPIKIPPKESVKIATGVYTFIQPDEFLMIVPRSSVGIKKSCMLSNQVAIIDSDYTPNEIFIFLYNYSSEEAIIEPKQAYAQGIFQKYLIGDSEEPTEVRSGGIGSTNK